MGLNKFTALLAITFMVATIVKSSTAEHEKAIDMKKNAIGGAATITMAMEDRLVTIKKCVLACGDDACADKCTLDALPTDPAEREEILKKAKEGAKIQFCIRGCESVAVCETLKQIEQMVDCSMSCTNFCGGLPPNNPK